MQRQYNTKWNVFENVWKVTFEGEIPLDLTKQAKSIKIILKCLKKGKACKKDTKPEVETKNSVEAQEVIMEGTEEKEQKESQAVEVPRKRKNNQKKRQQLQQQKKIEKEKEKEEIDSEEEIPNEGSSSKQLIQNSGTPTKFSQQYDSQNTKQTPTHKRSHSDIEVMVQQDKSSPPIKQVVKKLKGSDDISVVSITGSTVNNLTVTISRNGVNIVAQKGKELPVEIHQKVLISVAEKFSGYCELVRRWLYRQED